MALKLLKPSETKNAQEARESEDIRRADSIRNVVQGLLDERTKAERAFDEVLATQRARWEHEDAVHRETALSLRREIEGLEYRKQQALIPITQRENSLHTGEEALAARTTTLDEREASLEEQGRILMQHLDAVSTREQDAQTHEKKLLLQHTGIERQRSEVLEGAQRLSADMSAFSALVQEKRQEFKTERALLDSREVVQKERDTHLKAKEKDLENREKKLKDRYSLLERIEKKYL